MMCFTAVIDPLLGSDYLPIAVITWSLLVILDRTPRWRMAGLPVLAFLAALTCLVKANSGVAAICLFIAVLLVVVLDSLPLSRDLLLSIAASLLLFPVSLVLLYVVETGSLTPLPAYIRNALEIASGYSESMTFNGPYEQVLAAVIAVAVLFLVLPLAEILPALRPVRRAFSPASFSPLLRPLSGYLPALVYVFFAFKAAMVRQDTHAADFPLQLALAALFPLATTRRRLFLFPAICFQLVCLYLGYQDTATVWPHTARSRLAVADNLPSLRAFLAWSRTWAALDKAGWENLREQQVDSQLQAAIGHQTVESIPWDITRVRANLWNWHPRPVFQTYAAYTPRLDRLNADYLRSSRAADFTLVTWDDIDERHVQTQEFRHRRQ